METSHSGGTHSVPAESPPFRYLKAPASSPTHLMSGPASENMLMEGWSCFVMANQSSK
ncbi:unnamed protein product [Spirodela intermedia]|uniref:Uncharacterized protein n=2 Tax=Spirodela intermedia TaxID=51605 RepID=A0A7I8J9E5_SPIIN|nr:unnamed protein product [Spirodela intermedia]CAA6666838.1 unnamed protein product [Spirodela intermedia]CAA7403644.1 unnamed protein product [Spirodela intermedia]